MSERDWTEIFKIEPVEQPFHIETEASECNGNCLEAKELKCVCRCQGKNHGANLRKNVKPLDTFEEHVPQGTIDRREELVVLA